MGGTNELCISGFRAHVNAGCVHLHTEDGLKYVRGVQTFKSDLAEVARNLSSGDGVTAVAGDTDVSLIIGRLGRKTFSVLTRDGDVVTELKHWVDGC